MRILTPQDLGALVHEARRNAGLTQTELANKIGASRFWVAEFERGKPRAELGLALKAIRALDLVLTIERSDTLYVRERPGTDGGPITDALANQPIVDLSAILKRTATPGNWFEQTAVSGHDRKVKRATRPSGTTQKKQRSKPKTSKKKRA